MTTAIPRVLIDLSIVLSARIEFGRYAKRSRRRDRRSRTALRRTGTCECPSVAEVSAAWVPYPALSAVLGTAIYRYMPAARA
jgi:hypothetical protein